MMAAVFEEEIFWKKEPQEQRLMSGDELGALTEKHRATVEETEIAQRDRVWTSFHMLGKALEGASFTERVIRLKLSSIQQTYIECVLCLGHWTTIRSSIMNKTLTPSYI